MRNMRKVKIEQIQPLADELEQAHFIRQIKKGSYTLNPLYFPFIVQRVKDGIYFLKKAGLYDNTLYQVETIWGAGILKALQRNEVFLSKPKTTEEMERVMSFLQYLNQSTNLTKLILEHQDSCKGCWYCREVNHPIHCINCGGIPAFNIGEKIIPVCAKCGTSNPELLKQVTTE